ncbi:uncharacterized protein LOC131180179 [Hevea brasiliensis]|nr:uncharacterized protein LOC110648381 [Hevea brasiliensis]XP_058003791.1 uncharacterized protein LOC131180179 [Hevea brasiliensis]
MLPETLWAYRTSKRDATKTSPYALTYGHDAVLPMEIMVPSLRVARQHGLTPDDYTQAMVMELEDLDETRMQALNHMAAQKKKIARIYNNRVRRQTFQEGDIVWKTVLPVGAKSREFGKWSPTWEGPFRVHKVLRGNAYWLSSLAGELHRSTINGRYLKKYVPTMWEMRELQEPGST